MDANDILVHTVQYTTGYRGNPCDYFLYPQWPFGAEDCRCNLRRASHSGYQVLERAHRGRMLRQKKWGGPCSWLIEIVVAVAGGPQRQGFQETSEWAGLSALPQPWSPLGIALLPLVSRGIRRRSQKRSSQKNFFFLGDGLTSHEEAISVRISMKSYALLVQ